ncbi:MAG: hypothetical protein WBV94_25170 [Blastocatellia bacterium]
MTRTDKVKAVIGIELEKHRREIEENHDLRSVSVIVIFPRKRSEQIKILYRTEQETLSVS